MLLTHEQRFTVRAPTPRAHFDMTTEPLTTKIIFTSNKMCFGHCSLICFIFCLYFSMFRSRVCMPSYIYFCVRVWLFRIILSIVITFYPFLVLFDVLSNIFQSQFVITIFHYNFIFIL